MISKPDFIQHILEGSRASAKLAPKKTKAKATQAPPEEEDALAGFGFDDEPDDSAESVSPPAVETSFARTLLEKSLSASGQAIGTDDVILGGDPARKFLPAKLYYWPKADNRPFQTLLFELTMPSSELLKEPLFRPAKGVTEDALTRLVADTLRGFEQGGEARSADTKQGKQTETLCVVSIRDDRSKEYDSAHLVCLGTVSKSEGSLETFHIREEARFWEPQLAADHLERLYDRHFKKLDSEKWQDAFITGDERKLARKLMDVCQDEKRTEGKIQGAVVDLLEQIALSYGLRKKPGGRRLEATDLPQDHDIGVAEAVVAAEKKNPFKGMSLRDEKNRLLGYIIYCLDEKEDADELRKHLKANNRFHNVLVVYPNGESTGLELWQGQKPLEGKLTKRGAKFEGEGQVVNLLSRFFVVSKALVSNPVQLAEELAYRARYLRGFALRELEKAEAVRDKDLAKLYQAFHDVFLKSEEEDEAKQHDEFADSYAQTLTYGLLSARWIGKEELNESGERFTLENATGLLERTSPFFKDLFSQVISRSHDASRDWLLQDITDLLDRIDIDAVFTGVEDNVLLGHDPVMHFYEPFLEAYDKEIKRQRGVFYTPHPVVSYIVRSVHELLQTEFGLEDGLADTTTWGEMAEKHSDLELPPKTDEEGETETISPDEPFVQILDPATGTATFLVEVIDVIYRTLVAKWEKEGKSETEIEKAWNTYVPEHLLPRLYGYELMMAPYAIAHLKIGLKLAETGYRFGSNDRARVYLTNALEEVSDFSDRLPFDAPALAKEAEQANEIKSHNLFTVVIGNPPYSGRSYNLSNQARAIVEKYKYVNGTRLLEKGALQLEKNLNDDYVKFIGFTERIVASIPAVVGLITNHSFLENPTLRGMRWSLLQSFSRLELIDLGGNVARKVQLEDGSRDENVFDIGQGVSISLLARFPKKQLEEKVRCGALLGSRDFKYDYLNKNTIQSSDLADVAPSPDLYLFRVEDITVRAEYENFISLTQVFPLNSTGVKTHRDGFCIDFDERPLRSRICRLWQDQLSDDELRDRYGIPDTHGWSLESCRRKLREDEQREQHYASIVYRPFDIRSIYFSADVIELARMEVSQHFLSGENVGLVFMRQVASNDPYTHFGVTRHPVDNRAFYSNRGTMSFSPLYLRTSPKTGDDLFSKSPELAADVNLEKDFITAFERAFSLKLNRTSTAPDYREQLTWRENELLPEHIFNYIYAIVHSIEYRNRYSNFIKVDFPRIPHSANFALFRSLSELGHELIGIHLMESSKFDEPMSCFFGKSRQVGKPGWTNDEGGTVWLDGKSSSSGYRQGTAGFCPVPEEVWNLKIGGYQVCEKWLKDRQAKGGKNPSPGRTLTDDDIFHYCKIVTALSETIRLMAEIDEVIEAHGGWPGAFLSTD